MPTRRVLIVDDARELGRLLQTALSTLASHPIVSVVPSAEEALLETSHHQVDVMITDVRLPGISGIELTRRLRSRYPNVKTIQITGMNDPTLEAQAKEAGADYFFQKPLTMPVFVDAVERLLGVKEPDAPPPPTEPEVKTQTDRLVEVLAVLRQSLGAEQTALIDDRGRVIFEDLNNDLQKPDPDLLAALAETLQTGNKVSRILGVKDQENVLTFRGRIMDVLVSTVSSGYNLVVVLRNARTSVRLAIALDSLLTARKEVQAILADMGITPRVELRETPRPQKVQTRPLRNFDSVSVRPAAVQSAPEPAAAAAGVPVEVPPVPAQPEVAVKAPPTAGEQPSPAEPEPEKTAAGLAEPPAAAAPEVDGGIPIPPPAEVEPSAQAGSQAAEAAAAAVPGVDQTSEPAGEGAAGEFDALFNLGEKKIAPDEANAFWDEAAGKFQSQAQTGGISYEQAHKMGLTPDNLPEKE
jgi:CheY-like chemotaxis protein